MGGEAGGKWGSVGFLVSGPGNWGSVGWGCGGLCVWMMGLRRVGEVIGGALMDSKEYMRVGGLDKIIES